MRHLIDFGDLPRQEWDSLYHRASEIIDAPEKFIDVCRGKVSANLFYEPSTRTSVWAARCSALPTPIPPLCPRERR